jgi:hypothetical protein
MKRIAKTSALLLASVFMLLVETARAEGLDSFRYQIAMPASPISGPDALDPLVFDARAKAITRAVACGSELQFKLYSLANTANEDSTVLIIGKMTWIHRNQTADATGARLESCVFDVTVSGYDICAFFMSPEKCDEAVKVEAYKRYDVWRQLRRGQAVALRSRLEEHYPDDCKSPSFLRGVTSPPDRDNELILHFDIGDACLHAQVNQLVAKMQGEHQQMGTSGATCLLPFIESKGDWDMTVRNVMRIGFLDKQWGVLNDEARINLHENLMTAEGRPAERTYPLFGCGNNEVSTGSAQERVDERSWIEDAWNDVLEDMFWWLLLIIIAVLIGLFIVGRIVAGNAVAALTTAVVAAIAGAIIWAAQTDVPESENHLLMINSSKYLKNQLLIAERGKVAAKDYVDDQVHLKKWLLTTFQEVMKKDFIEYNSRPYHRLSNGAIHNLADFSEDPEVKTGARLVLDYAFAKFAVASHQGRRYGPFRRLRGALAGVIDVDSPTLTADERANRRNGIFDLVSGSDYQLALGLAYAGQVQALTGGRISFGAAGQAIHAVTSEYRPPDFVVDLAIRKELPVYQRFNHHTQEVYSSGTSYLISGGGVTSEQAYSGSGLESIDQLFSDSAGDRGAALPTVLFLQGPQASALQEFLRLDGEQPDYDEEFRSYDHNLCVFGGFACGLNMVIPPSLLGCLDNQSTPVGDPRLVFIDSRACELYADSPRFFLVLWSDQCPAQAWAHNYCSGTFGFFEIVDAPESADFQFFKLQVATRNRPTIVSTHDPSHDGRRVGVYVTTRGQRIKFAADAHQRDSDSSGIYEVSMVGGAVIGQPDIGDWPHAGGDPLSLGYAPIQSSGDGRVKITNRRLSKSITLDFKNVDAPKYAP